MPTWENVLPVLSVVVTALVGLLAYNTQERAKRATALSERKQGLYEELLRNLVELLVARTGAERSKCISKIERGWLFASDEVLQASYEYLNLYHRLCSPRDDDTVLSAEQILEKVRTDTAVRIELEKSLAEIFLAMRRDIGPTDLTRDWAESNLRIYPWGIVFEGTDCPPDTLQS